MVQVFRIHIETTVRTYYRMSQENTLPPVNVDQLHLYTFSKTTHTFRVNNQFN